MPLNSDSHYTVFLKEYLKFFMEKTDCISVSAVNELQTETRWEKGKKTQFLVCEISCIIPLEYHSLHILLQWCLGKLCWISISVLEGKLAQRLDINKLVFIEQLSPGGAVQQNTIAGSEQDFTLDSLS